MRLRSACRFRSRSLPFQVGILLTHISPFLPRITCSADRAAECDNFSGPNYNFSLPWYTWSLYFSRDNLLAYESLWTLSRFYIIPKQAASYTQSQFLSHSACLLQWQPLSYLWSMSRSAARVCQPTIWYRKYFFNTRYVPSPSTENERINFELSPTAFIVILGSFSRNLACL